MYGTLGIRTLGTHFAFKSKSHRPELLQGGRGCRRHCAGNDDYLWKTWGTLSSPIEAERMAIRIAKHECINVWRKAQRQPHSSLTISHETTLPAPNEGQALEESELRTAIHHAALTLRRSEQRLWRMFAEAGMAPKEIAIATGIDVRTVSSMLSHARGHIYNVLKEGGHIDG